jgi:hypothetical protein
MTNWGLLVSHAPLRYVDPTGHWTQEELIDALGEDWFERYFGVDAVFENREALLAFLLSENTTSSFVLDIVADMFGAAGLAHGAGFDFSELDAIGYRLAVCRMSPSFCAMAT